MSETQNEQETDAGPMAHEWVVERSGNWWIVKEYHTHSTGRYIYEGRSHQGRKDARLIAAAGTAAHELPEQYDAVKLVRELPEIARLIDRLHDETHEKGDPDLDQPFRTAPSRETVDALINALVSAGGSGE